MTDSRLPFTVFTKPWRDKSLPELARFVADVGFDGVELPVRPGYQVSPEEVAKLPEAAKVFADHGLRIGSVAGPTDEPTVAACAAAGVPIIRICVVVPGEKDYLAAIEDLQREWDALVPLLDRHGVALGIQNHCGRSIANGMQLCHAIGKYDPKHVCAVWDAGHNGLEGEQTPYALDAVWSHLRMVNLKSAYWRRVSAPDEEAQWRVRWTTGRDGRADWRGVVAQLRQRGWSGDLCFTAEYSDHDRVDALIREDIAFAREICA